jgi:AcrR family transcriptional regulator
MKMETEKKTKTKSARTTARKRVQPSPSKSKSSSSNPASSKDELFWKILDSAIRLECTRGHLKWKMTDLSRASGVTRSLIYYYFGQSKVALLKAAIQIIGEEFFGLDAYRHQLWEQGRVAESLRLTRELFKRAPYVGIFYQTQRQPGAVFYNEMIDLERRYIERLVRNKPELSRDEVLLLFATLFGLVTLHDLPDSVLDVLKF